MSSVLVENIGAVKHIEIPIPAEGGLVVLRGTQGCGKSTSLRAVESLLSGDGSLDKRDGTTGGTVSGFGATIKVQRSTRRSGVLEVETLDSKLSVADLVDPHIADPLRADAKRIKALIQLAGVEPDAKLFHCLFDGPEEFAKVVGSVALDVDDMVQLAATVKKRIEAVALEAESLSSKASGSAEAHRKSTEFVECEPAEPKELQAELEAAVREQTRLYTEAKNAKAAIQKGTESRRVIELATARYTGKTVEVAQQELDAVVEKFAEAKAELEAAQARFDAMAHGKFTAGVTLENAKTHAANMAGWNAAIEAAENVTAPLGSDLEKADDAVSVARKRIENAALYRKALDDRERAKQFEQEANSQRVRAERLRKAAKRTDEVLSNLVGRLDCPLRVKDGRLILDTDRGEELLADLSDGERYKVCLDIVIPYVPPHGVMTLPQRAYGELAPQTRRDINAKLKSHRVVMLSVLATDDAELTAEVFGE